MLTAIDEYRQRRRMAAGFIKWSRTVTARKDPTSWVKVLEAEVEDLKTAFDEEKNQVAKAHATISAMQRLNIEARKAGPERLSVKEEKPTQDCNPLLVGTGDDILKQITDLDKKIVGMEDIFLEDERTTFFFLEEECERLRNELRKSKALEVRSWNGEGPEYISLESHRKEVGMLEAQLLLYQTADRIHNREEPHEKPREEPSHESIAQKPAEIDRKSEAKLSTGQVEATTVDFHDEVIGEMKMESAANTEILTMLEAMESKLSSVECEQNDETSANFFFYEGEMERLREEIGVLRGGNLDMKAALENCKEEEAALRVSLRQLQRQMEVKKELDTEKLDAAYKKELRELRKQVKESSEKMRSMGIELRNMSALEEEVADLQTHVKVLMGEKDGFKAMAAAEKERRKAAERRMKEAEKKVELTRIRTLMVEAHQREKIYNQLQEKNSVEASKWKQAELTLRQQWAGTAHEEGSGKLRVVQKNTM